MPAKKVRNVKKRDPLRRKYGIPTLNDKKRHALRHPGFIAPKPVSHIEENQRRIAELESKLRDKTNGVVIGGTTIGGQVQPQPWVYKKPDAKESDPLSMVTNIAEQLGANSTLTTILKTAGKMSKADQETLLGYLNQGVNFVGKGIGAVLNTLSTPAETEEQKIEREKAEETAKTLKENATPVNLGTPIPETEPTKPPVIARNTIPDKKEPADGLAGITQQVVPATTFEPLKPAGSLGQPKGMVGDSVWYSDKPSYAATYSNAQGAPSGYVTIAYQPPPEAPALGVPQVGNSYETVPGTADPYKTYSNYLTNTSAAQVETLTPAEIEQQRQSSVLPITYPKPISQPTSAAPTSAAQPVDNSEVSNLEYMKTVLLATLAAGGAYFQNFLFDNPLLRETVQNAVVHGAKKIVDVLPYLREYINGMPREQIRQRFRSNV